MPIMRPRKHDPGAVLTRREALQAVAALLGVSATSAVLGAAGDALAGAADQPLAYLTAEQFALVERIADLMIPATDTPGAVGAGVPKFLDVMMDGWASDASRERFLAGLEAIELYCRANHGGSLVDLAIDEQETALRAFDRASYQDDAGQEAYHQLKALILFAYYSSEIGASVELRYNPIPGSYPGCVPLKDVGRAWNEHWGI